MRINQESVMGSERVPVPEWHDADDRCRRLFAAQHRLEQAWHRYHTVYSGCADMDGLIGVEDVPKLDALAVRVREAEGQYLVALRSVT
jgi:hypothetical protein